MAEDKYSHEQRMEMAGKGEAMPDGSYPVGDCEDIKNAVTAYGREDDAKRPELRRLIIRNAIKHGCTDEIPDDWEVEVSHD